MRLADSFIWRRAGSARLLLGCVLLSTLITASLSAALAGFAAQSLPRAVSRELAASAHTSIAVSGAFGTGQARTDGPAVRGAMRRAFGATPYTAYQALWSDPVTLPAARVSGRQVGGTAVSLIQAAWLGQIRAHAVLLAGSWPAGPGTDGATPAAVPASVAGALHLAPGRLLALRDRLTGARVRFRIVGVYRPAGATTPYWTLDTIGSSGVSLSGGFATYGPLAVAPGAFGPGGLAVGGADWLVQPRTARISAADLQPLAARISRLQRYLTRAPVLGGLQVSTGLPAALAGVGAKLAVARSLLTIGALEMLLLAVAVLALTGRSLAGQREEESAVLSARGAGRWQLARLALAEAVLVTAACAIAGPLAGSLLARLLSSSGPLRSIGAQVSGVPAAAWWTVAGVLLVCAAVMAWPALQAGNPGAVAVRKGRQAAVAVGIRAGGDAALVALAVLAGWQLRKYSALSRTVGGFGIDPVLAIAPAITLTAAAVLPLRLLPLIARAADRLAARTRQLGAAMVSWEISRRAVRRSASVLLVVVAVGTCTLALAQHQSWHQSAADQAAFAAGAEIRVQTPVPLPLSRVAAIAEARGVTSATPVTTSLTGPEGGQVLALDAASARATVLLRPDLSALPVAALWRRIAPAGPVRALPLPGRPARLEIVASISRPRTAGLGTVTVTTSVQDASGAVFAVPAGQLSQDGRGHDLIARLSPARQALYPLLLLAITVGYTLPGLPPRRLASAAAARTATLTLHSLAVSPTSSGAFPAPFAIGSTLAGWRRAAAAPDLAPGFADGSPPRMLPPGRQAGGALAISFRPGDGHSGQPAGAQSVLAPPFGPLRGQLSITAPVPFNVLPGIATTALLDSGHLAVGDVLGVQAGPVTIGVRIVAAVRAFPTISAPAGGLIVDLAAAQDLMAAQSAAPLPVSQWWLAGTSRAPPGLPQGTSVTGRERLLAALASDPMTVLPQQAVLSIAAAAALIAIVGFSVAIASRVRERRSLAALLAALGVRAGQQVRLLCLEAMLLSAPAAATGLLLGTVLARLLVPAVTLTAAATQPVPPAVVRIPLAAAGGIAMLIAVIPVLIAAAAAARKPDPAAQLRAADAP